MIPPKVFWNIGSQHERSSNFQQVFVFYFCHRMLFTDDTLIFGEATQEQMTYLWFEVLLGLKINLKKSELTLVGMVPDVELLDELGVEERFQKEIGVMENTIYIQGWTIIAKDGLDKSLI